MAIITEKLQLNKKFLIIDSPVPFTLRANNGTDEVYRMAGAWQLDTDKLLPEKYMKQYPVFNLDLVYDDTNLGNGKVVIRESNIDIGDGISGVNGQDVKVTNFNDLNLDLNKVAQETTLQTIAKETTLQTIGKESTLQSILTYLPELKKKYNVITDISVLSDLYDNADSNVFVFGNLLNLKNIYYLIINNTYQIVSGNVLTIGNAGKIIHSISFNKSPAVFSIKTLGFDGIVYLEQVQITSFRIIYLT